MTSTGIRFLLTTLLLIAATQSAVAQRGDKKGEVQGELPPELRLPKAPPLTPEKALAAFEVVDGYRVELAAAEPLVVDPVQVAFDAKGRLWVVEMRGFMPDADGKGEFDPVGRIAVLSDPDGDGRYDGRQDFMKDLVLPRGVLPWKDGALVILPPKLVFARDTDGDGVADQQEVILDKGFEAGLNNPEHAGNQPTLGHDGWIYFANFGKRLRQKKDGSWEHQKSHKSGQWGVSQDDWGRRVFNYNSSWLHGDRFSSHYAVRNSALGVAAGVNERFTSDQSVFSIRPNPGINRGYQRGMLTKDGKLARTTAVCGPGVYRGGLLPDAWIGDIFVPEPAANLVRHMKITEDESGARKAVNAHGRREFLASTDERFRPVQATTGPDGALYVVDLYRGILQHKNFLTTFLRKQIEARGLDTPIGLGRIWRVVPDSVAKGATKVVRADPKDVARNVSLLGHRNGIVREFAQSALLNASDRDFVASKLEDALASDATHLRYHAMWTLAHLGRAATAIEAGLHDSEARIRALAVRLAEDVPDYDLGPALADASTIVQIQLALTLSSATKGKRIEQLATLLAKHGDDKVVRQAALSGMGGREIEFVEMLARAPQWQKAPSGGSTLFRRVAQTVTKRRKADEIVSLLEGASRCDSKWQRDALVRGCVDGLPRGNARKASIQAKERPKVFGMLAAKKVDKKRMAALQDAFTWPGAENQVVQKKLSKAEERLFKLGKHYFTAHCVQCHQADGRGQAGLAPTLHDSEIVLGPAARQIRVVLHGLTGPVEIAGKVQNLTMEPLGAKLNDRQIAAILTFTRRSWGHRATAVSPTEVKRVRNETASRKAPWKRSELTRIQ